MSTSSAAGVLVALAVLAALDPRRAVPARVVALRTRSSHVVGPSPRGRREPSSEQVEPSPDARRWWSWLSRARRARAIDRERTARVRDDLPDVVDLLRLGAASGLNVRLTIEAVAPVVDGPIGDTLRACCARATLGVGLVDALDPIAELGDAARSLHAALVSAARDGTPLAASLDRVADEARTTRRRHAEIRARRLPVQLLFPLVLCILPAFGALTVVPLLAGSLSSLSG